MSDPSSPDPVQDEDELAARRTSSTPLQDAEEARGEDAVGPDKGSEDGSRDDGEQEALDAMPAGTAEGDDQVVGRQPDTGEDRDVTGDLNR